MSRSRAADQRTGVLLLHAASTRAHTLSSALAEASTKAHGFSCAPGLAILRLGTRRASNHQAPRISVFADVQIFEIGDQSGPSRGPA